MIVNNLGGNDIRYVKKLIRDAITSYEDDVKQLIKDAILKERARLASKIYYSTAEYISNWDEPPKLDWDKTVSKLRKEILEDDYEED
jgi:hypothetical protein